MLSTSTLRAIEDHGTKTIGPHDVLHELMSLDLHIDILLVKPKPKRDYHTLITMGMCDRAMSFPKGESDPKFAELMMYLPRSWKFSDEAQQDERYGWPLFWLQSLARFLSCYEWTNHSQKTSKGPPP
jgi:hypothetical protein